MLVSVTLLVATTTFFAFAWALKRHFVSAHMPPAMVALSGLSLVVFITTFILTWQVEGSRLELFAALVIYLASATLFAFSVAASRNAELRVAFDQAAPKVILSHGPYRFIRHPFYTSYLMFWLACALAVSWWPIWLAWPIFAAIYFSAARHEEKAILASPLGADYAAYITETGFMLPWVRS